MTSCVQCDVEHPRGAPDCPAQRLGRTLAGRYRIERLLGIGGMGAVYEAVHLELGQRVAIKAVRGRVAPSAETVERFQREARELSALRHPGIVEVRDLGRDEAGMPFMVMELLEGENLADRLARGSIDVAHVVRLGIEALDALAEAHAHSIIHRDLKPANLFLAQTREGERIKVLDFGIAKVMGAEVSTLTETGLMIGSAPYMSPEQTSDSKRIDPRSDVYAMGATLFELLTGRLSAEGATSVQIVVRIAKGDIQRHPAAQRPDVPDWLDAIVAKALATDPAERFQNALEMNRALQDGPRVGATPVTTMPMATRPAAAGAPGPVAPLLASRPVTPAGARATPAALAVTAPATPPGPVPGVSSSSRTPAPAVLSPAPVAIALAPAERRRARGRGVLLAGLALSAIAATLVVAVPRWREPTDAAGRPPATAPRPAPAPAESPPATVPETTAQPPAPPTPPPPEVPATAVEPTAPPKLASTTKRPRRVAAITASVPAPVAAPTPPAVAPPTPPEPGPAAPSPAPVVMTFAQGDDVLLPTSEENLPQIPSMFDLMRRTDELRPAVNRCAPGRRVVTRFQVAGATGRARAIQLVDFDGTPAQGQCVAAVLRAASFPRFRVLVFPTQHTFAP